MHHIVIVQQLVVTLSPQQLMRNMAWPFSLLFLTWEPKFAPITIFPLRDGRTHTECSVILELRRCGEMELCPYTFVFPPIASCLPSCSSSGSLCCLPALERNLSPLSSLEGSAPPSQDFWLPWPWVSHTSSPELCSLFCRQLEKRPAYVNVYMVEMLIPGCSFIV